MRCCLFHLSDEVSQVHRVACGNVELSDSAPPGRFDLVLHLHGFHDDNALMGFDLRALSLQDPNNLSRHRCADADGTFLCTRVPEKSSPGTFKFDESSLPSNDDFVTVLSWRHERINRSAVAAKPQYALANPAFFQPV